MVIPRIVGPQCRSVSTNQGEENALYKHLLCTPICCRGQGQCADPRNFQPFLFPNADGRFTFKQRWKARRAEIEVLAVSGCEKLKRAKRIPVIQDTTVWKRLRPPRPVGAFVPASGSVLPELVQLIVLGVVKTADAHAALFL